MGISVITCTGGRPEALSHLSGYVERQTYKGELQWIVVNDVDESKPELEHTFIKPPHYWEQGLVTIWLNLLAAFREVNHDKILIMEDDDWYSPTYIETYDKWLDDYTLVGEGKTRYYNVRDKTYRQWFNMNHAALCQTGFRGEVMQIISEIGSSSTRYVDLTLWRSFLRPATSFIYEGLNLNVGIKGMIGRNGVCDAHRQINSPPDENYDILKQWIGDDYHKYTKYAE